MRNQRGIAMLMALMTMTVLGILIAELVYQTEVYHRVVFGQTDQLRAKYLAKAGLKLAILQLHAAKKAKEKIKGLDKSLGATAGLAEKIWQTPIILPPPVPKGMAEADKSSLDAFVKSLDFNGRVAITIIGESQKLNLNQLVWIPEKKEETKDKKTGGTTVGATAPINPEETLKTTRELYRDLMDAIFQNKKQEDDSFREKYANLNANVLLGNLLAWMDPNTPLDGENRNKEEYYSRLPNPYSPKNAPLSSMSELYMVRGFDDELVNLLSDDFTTLLTEGVNVNSISASLMRSLIPGLSPADAEKVIERRNDPSQGGPFTSADDFWTFLETFGTFKEIRKELEKKGLAFTTEDTAYRVSIVASSGYAKKSWLAYVGEAPPEIKDTKSPTQAPSIDLGAKNLEDVVKSTEKSGDKLGTKNDNKLPAIIYLKAE